MSDVGSSKIPTHYSHSEISSLA